jgi:ribosomal protein L10
MKQEILYDLLNRALEEELGIVVTTNNPQQMSYRFHEIKKSHSRYADIEITVPSTPETVMLVKKSVELDEPVYDAEGDLPDE